MSKLTIAWEETTVESFSGGLHPIDGYDEEDSYYISSGDSCNFEASENKEDRLKNLCGKDVLYTVTTVKRMCKYVYNSDDEDE